MQNIDKEGSLEVIMSSTNGDKRNIDKTGIFQLSQTATPTIVVPSTKHIPQSNSSSVS